MMPQAVQGTSLPETEGSRPPDQTSFRAAMQSIQTWLGGGAPDKEPAPKSSVLSEWNKYSTGSGGVAPTAAAPATGTADPLIAAEAGTSTAQGALCSCIRPAENGFVVALVIGNIADWPLTHTLPCLRRRTGAAQNILSSALSLLNGAATHAAAAASTATSV
jgi:hypothetical protein